ncbi:MAG TPA: hypothetical protein VGY13_04775 [Solirubrobacteraceae bacterium]|nr:hypothetical protein [Solirubrobacteraceae bacterium]
MSFFDDDEETAPRAAQRSARRPTGAGRPAGAAQPRRPGPRPRRPQHPGVSGVDQHTLNVRRGVAAGVGLVLLILVVLLISSLVKNDKQQSLKTYNHEVGALAQESGEHVSGPLFAALNGAAGKSAQSVEQELNSLRDQAQALEQRAKTLSVPSEMASAQQNLLLALDLRVEGMDKLAELLPSALGGQSKQLAAKLAGDMEIFLASDVIYSQRVAPLIQQTLAAAGVQGIGTGSSRFLPNVGWLEPSTLLTRLGEPAGSGSSSGAVAPGHHGSVLKGVSVGSTALEAEPAVNHLSVGANPTFTLAVEDDGEFTENNVKVVVTITAGAKQYSASHVVGTTEPGKTVNANVTVTGVPLGAAAKVEAGVEPVPGETNHEGTHSSFLAVFE